MGVISSHRNVAKAASVHGGESWRSVPAMKGGGKQPPRRARPKVKVEPTPRPKARP